MPQRWGNGATKAIRMHTSSLWMALVFLLSVGGCAPYPTLRGYRNSIMGSPIDHIKELNAREGSYASSIGWKETTYPLANGNWAYVDPYAPNCVVHLEVNPTGIIVGSRAEGSGCDMWPFR